MCVCVCVCVCVLVRLCSRAASSSYNGFVCDFCCQINGPEHELWCDFGIIVSSSNEGSGDPTQMHRLAGVAFTALLHKACCR